MLAADEFRHYQAIIVIQACAEICVDFLGLSGPADKRQPNLALDPYNHRIRLSYDAIFACLAPKASIERAKWQQNRERLPLLGVSELLKDVENDALVPWPPSDGVKNVGGNSLGACDLAIDGSLIFAGQSRSLGGEPFLAVPPTVVALTFNRDKLSRLTSFTRFPQFLALGEAATFLCLVLR